MNKLILLSLFALFHQGISQHLILPRNDAARHYIVSVHGDFNLINPDTNSGGTYLCIGTYVTIKSVLTAASCVASRANLPGNLFVMASSTLMGNPNDGLLESPVVVHPTHIHPEFASNPVTRNLAVLRVC